MLSKIKSHVVSFMPALRSRNYRLFFLGQGISLVGSWMQSIAEQWLIYPVLTTNKSLLGLVSAVNLLPTICFVLVAGVIADRINKRKVFILFQIIYAVIAFILFLLISTKTIQIWHVFVATFIAGIIFSIESPTRQSFMVSLVDKKDLPSALSLSSGMFNGARAIGPALAGLLIAAFGLAPAYLINSISFFAVIISLFMMRFPKEEPHVVSEQSLLEGLKEGFLFVWHNKIFGVLFSIVGIMTLCTWPAATLLPVFAHDVYHKGELGFGLLQSFFGVGAVIGAVTFAKLFERVTHKFHLLVMTVTTISVAGVLFSLSGSYSMALVVRMIQGWALSTTYSMLNTMLTMYSPNALRGRMMSFYYFMMMGSMPVGALFASAGVGAIGPRMTVLAAEASFGILFSLLVFGTGGKIQKKMHEMSIMDVQ